MRNLGPRGALSQVLIAGALVLLIAIGAGIGMGNRVLGQIAGREPVLPTPVPLPTATSGQPGGNLSWKHVSVMSVATDPAFPDPRVTPEPDQTPRPRRPKPSPSPKPTKSPEPTPSPATAYTSPPMPIPMATATPGEVEATLPPAEPRATARPPARPSARPPTLPPVPIQTLSP